MRAKYESKYERFYRLKQLDAVITDTATELKISKLQVAEYVQHFLKWQKDALIEMKSPSYHWYGFGYIQARPFVVHNWDKLKQRELTKLNELTNGKDEQTDEK